MTNEVIPPITPSMPGEDPLSKLNGVELVQLAMLAFIHMNREGKISKEDLLDHILNWFEAMTDDVKMIEPHQYIQGTGTLQ